MLRMARGEVGAGHPRLEVVLGSPLREDEADLALVVGAQELEPLEAVGARHPAGSGGEAVLELGEAVTRHGDRVDLHDAHGAILTGDLVVRRTIASRAG